MLYCGKCVESVSANCAGSFRRIGLHKVHWECWDECNLSCDFCYRTRSTPLNQDDAMRLIDAVATGGASTIVFAGGDPSLRNDMSHLVAHARANNLRVEIHTNAHSVKPAFLGCLISVDEVGLSLDGPTELIHDHFRNKPGNFQRVVCLMRVLAEASVPVVVRSIVARENGLDVPMIGSVLSGFENIRRWSVMQFSPNGNGFVNRARFEVADDVFFSIVEQAAAALPPNLTLDAYPIANKAGTYCLISPNGDVYGIPDSSAMPRPLIIGSILRDHLSEIATRLPFSVIGHELRYGIGGVRNS